MDLISEFQKLFGRHVHASMSRAGLDFRSQDHQDASCKPFLTRRGPRISGFQTAPNVLGSTGPTRVADRRILEPGSAKDGRVFLDTEGYPKNSVSYPKTPPRFGQLGIGWSAMFCVCCCNEV